MKERVEKSMEEVGDANDKLKKSRDLRRYRDSEGKIPDSELKIEI